MAVQIEGFGEDWVVTRKASGGKPELSTFKSIDEFKRVMRRLLLKAEQSSGPVVLTVATEPVVPAKPVSVAISRPPVRPAPRPLPVKHNPVPPHRRPAPVAQSSLTLDCTTCGACCAPADQSSNTHAVLEEQDFAVIPIGRRRALVAEKSDRKFVSTKQNNQGFTVCSALSGTIGHQCSCSIYDQRPVVCRLFEPGSPECLQARRAFKVGEDG